MWIRDKTRILHQDTVNVKNTHDWIRDKTCILHQDIFNAKRTSESEAILHEDIVNVKNTHEWIRDKTCKTFSMQNALVNLTPDSHFT